MVINISKIYDHRRSDSLSTKLRKQRLSLFTSLLSSVPTPIKILDVGGTETFWENAGFFNTENNNLEITVINMCYSDDQPTHPKIKRIVGNAKKMEQFRDREFDVVFSNSVIEHVGDYEEQAQMAREVIRVGKRYFIQTPNLYFPIEAHFVFPFFQFLPVQIRVWLLMHFDLGWNKKVNDKHVARELVTGIKLLSKKKLIKIFPKSNLHEEKLLGMTKSFVIYGG